MNSAQEVDVEAITRIGVYPPDALARIRPLTDSLDMVLPVRLLPWDGTTQPDFDALLAFHDFPQIQAMAARAGVRCLAFLPRSSSTSFIRTADLQFAASPDLPVCLRGRSVEWTRDGIPAAMRPAPGDDVLAQWDGAPVWVRSRAGNILLDCVNAHLPHFDGVLPGIAFRAGGYIPFIPLLQFLKETVGAKAWQPPPLRACFLFDDPNLSRMSYGFLNFPELIAYTIRLDIHVCIAVVPLDMSKTSPKVANLFRANSKHVSIAAHGINHTKLEILKLLPGALASATLLESIRRVEDMESRHSLTVSRIMEAPHGIFSFPLAAAIGAAGYEGALVSLDFLARVGAPECLPISSGMLVAEILSGGLCGIPRIRLTPAWRRDAVLAALLGQPIVVAGHHWNARGGLDFLAEMASEVRRLGVTEWTDLSTIAQSAYLTRIEGRTLRVRPLCRHTVVQIQAGVSSLCVASIRSSCQEQETFVARFLSAERPETERLIVSGTPIEVDGATRVDLVQQRAPLFNGGVAQLRTGVWPRLRRFLAVARDRTYLVSQFLLMPPFRRRGE